MFESLIGKPFVKSFTMWGMVAIGAVRSAEALGLVSPGTSVLTDGVAQQASGIFDALGQAANAVGGALVVLGLRRAAANR